MKFFTRFKKPEVEYSYSTPGHKSKVRQSEADNCDINKIMERFNRTGKLPAMQTLPPKYGDARIVDYSTALNIVKEAQDQFKTLSSDARKYFGHDPQNFLRAISDRSEDNVKQLLKLGILIPKEETPTDVLKRVAKNTEKKEEKPS